MSFLLKYSMGKKLKIGLFSFTADEGCMIVLLEILNYKFFEWKDKIDIRFSRLFKSSKDFSDLDVAFVEGTISTPREEEKVKAIRANAKRVVAVGTCAINGSPTNLRNSFNEDKMQEIGHVLEKFDLYPKIKSVKEVIPVDKEVPGCPMIENGFVKVMEEYMKEFGVS